MPASSAGPASSPPCSSLPTAHIHARRNRCKLRVVHLTSAPPLPIPFPEAKSRRLAWRQHQLSKGEKGSWTEEKGKKRNLNSVELSPAHVHTNRNVGREANEAPPQHRERRTTHKRQRHPFPPRGPTHPCRRRCEGVFPPRRRLPPHLARWRRDSIPRWGCTPYHVLGHI